MKPKKIIRSKIIKNLQPGEWEEITDLDELNRLYALKVQEELCEIQNSNNSDVEEFVDLVECALAYAFVNGYNKSFVWAAMQAKQNKKGVISNFVLNNLNPDNPSNKIYFTKALENENVFDILQKLVEKQIRLMDPFLSSVQHNDAIDKLKQLTVVKEMIANYLKNSGNI